MGVERQDFVYIKCNKLSMLHNPMITFGDLWRGHHPPTEETLAWNMTLQTQGSVITGFSLHRAFPVN